MSNLMCVGIVPGRTISPDHGKGICPTRTRIRNTTKVAIAYKKGKQEE